MVDASVDVEPVALRTPHRVMYSAEAIAARIADMGREIGSSYGTERPVLIAVLKGAFVFVADLSRALTVPHEIDFLTCSSYGDQTTSSGTVVIHHDVRTSLRGRHVLIVEGVVDTGLTLSEIIKHLRQHEPASIKVATLLDKVACRKVPVDVHYAGFRIVDEFVVGYGMDYASYLRNLPYVGVIESSGSTAVHETAACDPQSST
jgi:hypoxanthine phosphoribosyltransferase